MTSYFEKHKAQPIAPTQNPAEWVLEVIGAAAGTEATKDWAQVWRSSSEFGQVKEQLETVRREAPTTTRTEDNVAAKRSFATPFYFQLFMCTKRAFEQYWRTPSYIWAKLILCSSSVSRLIHTTLVRN